MMTPCSTHPDYKVQRQPTGDCQKCWALWREKVAVEAGDLEAQEEKTEVDQLRESVERLDHDLKSAQKRERDLLKRALRAERIRENVFDLVKQPVEDPGWMVERSVASGAPHVAVLVTSDFQWGEVIDKDNMDGINEYNVEIAQKRYQRMVERTIDLSFEHLAKNRYSGLVMLRLGDTVSGDIHEELKETNQLAAIPAVQSVVEAETWGLKQLTDAFERVHVVSVPGNHGRVTRKPPTKRVEVNYDYLASWALEREFKGDSRVTWQTPKSTDAVFNLHGRRYLATHGDNIGTRGGQGFVGPIATISRGATLTMREYAARGTPVSKMFLGHFHVAHDFGRGWSNGSLPGYSEYARAGRLTPEPPQQWLIMFHPRWGDTSQWKIRCEPEPPGDVPGALFS